MILYAIAFLTAFTVAYYSVYTDNRFHSLFFLIWRNNNVILYSLIYGLIGAVLFLILKESVLNIEGNETTFNTEYLYAIAVGSSTRAVADLNLFNIRGAGMQIPFGVKILSQPLDQFFEKRFNAVSFKKARAFLTPYQKKYAGRVGDIDGFKNEIAKALQQYPDRNFSGGFISSDSFTKATDCDELLTLVLSQFGESVFNQIFDGID